jgi:heme/copper-type cytochrome/quinol oxidase subunit 2
MGFDEGDRQPLIHLRRWGTKVNIAMALGIIVFLVFGVFAVCWTRSHNNKVANAIQQKTEDKH